MSPLPPAEDPFDAWRKRFFAQSGMPPEFFHEFEREFARMQGMIGKIMDDAMRHASGPRRSEPFVYGFSLRVGKDGQPHLEPFGSATRAPPGTVETTDLESLPREPLTDIVEGEKEIAVTVELPGVEKKDVNLHVAEDALTVRVEKGRLYHKRITLPDNVKPDSARATFKNGVLDVTIQRKQTRADPGHRVNID